MRGRVACVVTAALILAASCWAATSTAIADDVDTVQQFLARLGLVEIQVLHLEKTLQGPLPDERRVELARRLADLYAGLLMSTSQDEEKSQEIYARVDSLIKRVPEADTPSLGVLLLQADYNRAEAEVAQWLRRPDDATARDAARAMLSRVVPRLREHQAEIERLVKQWWEEIEAVEDEQALAVKEAEVARLEAVGIRAAFLSGWADYYSSIVTEDSQKAKNELATARQCFRKVLDLADDDPLDEITAEWFNLEAVGHCRALIGLGMAEAAGGDRAGSHACFRVLEDPAVPPAIRDEAGYWHVQGLVNAGAIEEAGYVLEEQMGRWSGRATPGEVGACTALVAAAFGDKASSSGKDGAAKQDERRAAGMVGIAGLVRLKQFDTLGQLTSQYAIDAEQAGGLLLYGLEGRKLLDKAEASQDPDDYRAAEEALTKALTDPNAEKDVALAGQWRYLLGWCHYRRGQYKAAAEQFEQATGSLKAVDQPTAVKAAWKAVESYYQAASENPRYVASAIRLLEAIRRDFPGDPLTQKVDYYVAKIRHHASGPEELIRSLRRVKPDSPNYLTSRHEICLLEHQRWTAARGTADRSAVAGEVYQAVDAYLSAAKDGADPAEKLRCLLLAAEVALSADRVDLERVRLYLDQATALASGLPATDTLAADYHYRRFQLAGETGDDQHVREHAEWLARHAAGSGYELPALVELAKEADAAVAAAGGDRLRSSQEQAYAIYARLVKLLGDGPKAISSQKNALVASSKLAAYLGHLGRHAEAAGQLEKILAVYPNDQGYLRRAGLALFQAESYDRALPHWRKLLAGLPRESVVWYEAKYHQLACLIEVDEARAREVFGQFELLHPDFGPEPWREKLRSLQRRLGQP
ncbi:MAG TPA: hypothetical protein VMY37_32885 [Thermoguttaceae bacterium]|nr:hypothetical protein [Thermoguttaceae bacterium]